MEMGNATDRGKMRGYNRELEAVKLRTAGFTYQQIADQLDYAGPQGAYEAVKAILARREQEAVDELRKIQHERLDTALRGIWPKVMKGDPKAVLAFLKIEERRARLEGVDSPTKIEHSGGVSFAEVARQQVNGNGKEGA